jgi:RNA polymerase sigma factor (sigma-70 family)
MLAGGYRDPRLCADKHAIPVAHPAVNTHPSPSMPRTTVEREVERIVRAAAGGDDAAWEELVARFGGLVWAVARGHRLSSADAADVVQCTWLKLVQHLPELRNPAAVGGWLATTARREAVRVLQASKQQIPCGDEMLDRTADEPALDAELLRRERDATLWQAVEALRPEDRALVRMLAADPPASYSEISAALGMPTGSIGPTRARCLQRLRAGCATLYPTAV